MFAPDPRSQIHQPNFSEIDQLACQFKLIEDERQANFFRPALKREQRIARIERRED